MQTHLKTHIVYMLRCADGSFYTGWTTDLERRLRAHNGQIRGGAAYTRSRRPVEAVYTACYADKSKALKEEYRLKQMTHKEKCAFLKAHGTLQAK